MEISVTNFYTSMVEVEVKNFVQLVKTDGSFSISFGASRHNIYAHPQSKAHFIEFEAKQMKWETRFEKVL